MERQSERRETRKNITDHSSSSGRDQHEIVSKVNGISSRKTHARKNSDYLLGGRGMQTPIVREIDRDLLQRLSRMELLKKNAHPARKTVQCRNETDRPNKDCCCGICLHETKGNVSRRDKCVRFDMNLTVYEIPYEERRSEWMTVAADRFRFERRIQLTGLLIEPMLKKHLK